MNSLYNQKKYIEDVQFVASLHLPWEKLKNGSIMISGATGMIGSFLVDVILEKNASENFGCTVYVPPFPVTFQNMQMIPILFLCNITFKNH